MALTRRCTRWLISRSVVLFDVAGTLFDLTPGLEEMPYSGDILQDLPRPAPLFAGGLDRDGAAQP
jgi:hypothetical protein